VLKVSKKLRFLHYLKADEGRDFPVCTRERADDSLVGLLLCLSIRARFSWVTCVSWISSFSCSSFNLPYWISDPHDGLLTHCTSTHRPLTLLSSV
jgi:hypothetical protein